MRVFSEEKIALIWSDLEEMHSEVHRAYHNLEHLEKMLGMLKGSGEASVAVELAIWFRDAIYDPRSNSNERMSADYFCEVARDHVEGRLVADVRRLILATDPSSPRTGKSDEDLIIDINLGILGASTSDYEAYCAAVRKEYSFVDDVSFARGRPAILKGFLAGRIYATREYAGLEQGARLNLASEIQKLEGTIGF